MIYQRYSEDAQGCLDGFLIIENYHQNVIIDNERTMCFCPALDELWNMLSLVGSFEEFLSPRWTDYEIVIHHQKSFSGSTGNPRGKKIGPRGNFTTLVQ
jgi:hypothetical protein